MLHMKIGAIGLKREILALLGGGPTLKAKVFKRYY